MRPAVVLVGAAVWLVVACAAPDAGCAEVAQTPDVASALSDFAVRHGWTPVIPCAAGAGFAATSVLTSDGAGAVQVTMVVTRRAEPAFTFTQAESLPPWQAIPIGTRHVEIVAAGARATGYEGGTGSGGAMLYLRWEVNELAFEYQALASAGWPLAAARASARGTLERSLGSAQQAGDIAR